jgi:hypothetical protein
MGGIVMKRKSEDDKTERDETKKEVRMELKYCERCGGLWLRECGAGVVYCEQCQVKVEELPAPVKKPAARVNLPVRRSTVMREDFGFDPGDEDEFEFEDEDFDDIDLDAMGGVA